MTGSRARDGTSGTTFFNGMDAGGPVSIIEWLEATCRKHGERNALTPLHDDVSRGCLTYTDLWDRVSRFAGFLKTCSLKRGDRVLILLPKSLSVAVAHFALLNLGLIAVHLNPGFTRDEIRYFMEDTGAALILADPARVDFMHSFSGPVPVAPVPPVYSGEDPVFGPAGGESEPAPAVITTGDPALIIYTSGTTGKPKGALLTHGNLVNDARNIITAWEIGSNDVLYHSLPLFHIHGLCFALHTLLLSGGHIILADRFDAGAALSRLSSKMDGETCTIFMAVPTMYVKLIEAAAGASRDFSSLRLITSGSAPLPSGDFERIKGLFGMEPVEREGMSETGMNFSNPLRGMRKPGSVGLPLPGLEVRITDPYTGRDVSRGGEGELLLMGPSIMKEYWGKPEETAGSFTDGWFRTGDLGCVDRDGYYYLTDRLKHVIITGGEKVSPKEVEAVIDNHHGVVESCVVGVPDPVWGERVAAAVVSVPGSAVLPDQVIEHCRRYLHSVKCPREVIFVEKIPKNRMGKTEKDEVKKWFT